MLAQRLACADPGERAAVMREILAFARLEQPNEQAAIERFGFAVAEQGAALLHLLEDPVLDVRVLAVETFAELALWDWEYCAGAWQCAPKLIRLVGDALVPLLAMASDPDPRVRIAVVQAVHRTSRYERLPAAQRDVLIRSLADPVAAVRAAGVEAVVARLDRDAERLVTPLAADGSPEVRAVIASALVEVRSPRAKQIVLAEARRAGPAAEYAEAWRLTQVELTRDEARELLVPLLGDAADDSARRITALSLCRYVDPWWNPLLARLVERPDDPAWPGAVMALARLGPAVASDGLARHLEEPRVHIAGWAAAACERADLFPLVRRALARTDSPSPLIHIASAFAVPELYEACARYVEAPTSRDQVSVGCLALGASGRREGISTIRAASVADHPLARARAALGIALIDPDALDLTILGPRERWLPRIYTFEEQALGVAFALRLLGRRLRARGTSLAPPARELVDRALAFIAESLDETPEDGWQFLIRDLLGDARTALQAAIAV